MRCLALSKTLLIEERFLWLGAKSLRLALTKIRDAEQEPPRGEGIVPLP